MKKHTTLGIPQSLSYLEFSGLWESAFTAAGADIHYSGSNNRTVMDLGIECTVSEACLPMKLIHGQVASLAQDGHPILVPRLVNVSDKTVFCPKFLGLPDMLRAAIGDAVRIVSPRIDLRKGVLAAGAQFFSSAKALGLDAIQSARAAVRSIVSFDRSLESSTKSFSNVTTRHPSVAVLGYPYLVDDEYANLGLLGRLTSLDCLVIRTQDVSRSLTRPLDRVFGKQLLWHYSDRVVKVGYYLSRNHIVDGVIHLTAFGCGPDAVADKLLELECARNGTPYLTLAIDECTGEAGLQTRVEAFVDMLRRRSI